MQEYRVISSPLADKSNTFLTVNLWIQAIMTVDYKMIARALKSEDSYLCAQQSAETSLKHSIYSEGCTTKICQYILLTST